MAQARGFPNLRHYGPTKGTPMEARKHAALRGKAEFFGPHGPYGDGSAPPEPERREADRRKDDRWTTERLIAECRKRGIL